MWTLISRGRGGSGRRALLLAALLLALAGGVKGMEEETLLFVITGQSNAGAHGRLGQVPMELRGEVDGVWFYSPMATRRHELAPMAAQRGAFGVEVPFARAIAAACPGRTVVVAKVWSNGTSIFAWDPDTARQGWAGDMAKMGNARKKAMWPQVVGLESEARAAAVEMGLTVGPVAGVLWIQGERDARVLYGAERYEANLRGLIAAWRNEWGEGMPVVGIDSHTNLTTGGGELVHDALEAVKLDTAGFDFVATRDLPKKDGAHFNTAGVMTLGERMAASWLALNGGCE